MFLQILFIIFIIVSVINVAHFGLYLIGANYYDIKRYLLKANPVKTSRRIRPLVTVLIPAHNESSVIIRTLESVRKSSHRKLQIIVVDDGSTDDTKKIVSGYIKKHPTRDIKLMYKQKNVGKASALNHALKYGAKGEFIMTLDADSTIDKTAVANAIKYFDDPKVVGVAANVRILDNFSVLGLLQIFEYMIGYRSKKFYSSSNSEFIIGGVASTYRASTLKNVKYYDKDIITEDIALSLKIAAEGNKDNRLVYGVDVVARTEAVGTYKGLLRQRYRWKLGILQSLVRHRKLAGNVHKKFSRTLTFYRIPMSILGEVFILLEPFAIVFIIYIMIKSDSISLLIGAYMTITGYLLYNIWPDELMTTTRKIKMSLYAPFMYFVFYLMNIVQLTAIVRCIISPNKVLLKREVQATWTSPERSLQTQRA